MDNPTNDNYQYEQVSDIPAQELSDASAADVTGGKKKAKKAKKSHSSGRGGSSAGGAGDFAGGDSLSDE